MIIKSIKRPGETTHRHNFRKDKDMFCQSAKWKQTRAGFIASEPWINLPSINGMGYSNKYCADCWQNGRINSERIEIDHIHARADGGDPYSYTNLRSRCHAHHNGKTHNERKKRYTKM